MLVITTFAGGDGINGGRGGGGTLTPPLEYHSPVHCNPTNTGAVSGGVEDYRSMGDTEVVVTIGYRPGGNEDGGVRTNGGRIGGGYIVDYGGVGVGG